MPTDVRDSARSLPQHSRTEESRCFEYVGVGGSDCIVGGGANDSLRGDGGTDVCIGGPGTDTFHSSCETQIQ